MPSQTFRAGNLTAIIGDNGAEGAHRAGYNGVWSLTHKECARNLFVPAFAGLNLEHVFDGDHDEPREVFFQPRNAPMELKRVSGTEIELHQPPIPTFHVESWTRFEVTAPDTLDLNFRCRATQHMFQRGYMGVFWASYIQAPEDKSMYFMGGEEGQAATWQQLCTPRHDDFSTVRKRDDKLDLTFREGHREALYCSISPIRYDLPFFYGNFENMTFLAMFQSDQRIRLTQSPSGGGGDPERKTSCPAWDFQMIVSPYDVRTDYRLRVRTVYRRRMRWEEILAEYNRWKAMAMP